VAEFLRRRVSLTLDPVDRVAGRSSGAIVNAVRLLLMAPGFVLSLRRRQIRKSEAASE
jgi:hypothetical protein